LVGVDSATINRAWLKHNWMREVDGETLLRIMAVVPDISSTVENGAIEERRREVMQHCNDCGLKIDLKAYELTVTKHDLRPQFILTGMDAMACLVQEDYGRAVQCLRSLWGRAQTRALDFVFGQGPGDSKAFLNTEVALEAAEAAFESLGHRRGAPFPRTISQDHLAHHIGKTKGTFPPVLDGSNIQNPHDQKEGLFVRGAVMGALRSGNDFDLAERYQRLVENNGSARIMELWAFPTWCGDSAVVESFELSLSLRLPRTAREVVAEVRDYNEAYVYYLLSTFIPLALREIDDTFGNELGALRQAILGRAESVNEPMLRKECTKLADALSER
jgi:hypothetical protein